MSLSDVGQTFGSQSQSRRNVIAGWPKDPRGSWMPGGSKKKKKKEIKVSKSVTLVHICV